MAGYEPYTESTACSRHGAHAAGEAWCSGTEIFAARQQEHRAADGSVIREGSLYWDNDLRLVIVTQIAESVSGGTAWHQTRSVSDGRRGSSDSGRLSRIYRPYDGPAEDAWSDEAWQINYDRNRHMGRS